MFSPNTRKYGPERTPYFGIFHAVLILRNQFVFTNFGKFSKKKIANFCSAYSANVQSYFIMFKNRRLARTIWIDNPLQWTRTVETQNVLRCESINQIKKKSLITLSEKCPYSEFILVRIFPHSDWIRRETEYLSVFSPTVGKYGPE